MPITQTSANLWFKTQKEIVNKRIIIKEKRFFFWGFF
jgi:hypothetical protein